MMLTLSFASVHPRDKITVGERLALSGLAVAYHQFEQRFQGPFPRQLVLDSMDHLLTIGYDQDILVKTKDGYEVGLP